MKLVEKFQRQLQLQGFNPGTPDGDFGPKTYKAAIEALSEAGMKDNLQGKSALVDTPTPPKRDLKHVSSSLAHKIDIPKIKRSVNEIIWHCAATPEGRSIGSNPARTIDKWHRQRGWREIGYHAVIDMDGKIYPGRNWNQTGAHVKNHNRGTLGFSYVGGVAKDGKTAKDTRTKEQRATMLWLTQAVTSQFPKITKITGHNQYAAKACPSFSMPDDELANIPGFIKGRKQ